MVNQVWGKHSTVVTGSQDGSKQISKNEWNENLNRKGLLGFDSETIASASDITIPDDSSDDVSSFIKLSGSTNVNKFINTNTSDGDLLYLITTGSVTLVNVSSPSVAGQIRLLGNANKDLSTTVPTILMRVGDYWYEYGVSGVILTPSIITSSLTTVGTIGTGVWNGTAVGDTYISSASTWNGKQDALTFGISNTNVSKAGSGIVDDDFIRVDGTTFEGRSSSEVLTDIGASAMAGSSSIVTTGALDSGSITSGFGNINIGSSTITTTGAVATGAITTSGTLTMGDNIITGIKSLDTDIDTLAWNASTVIDFDTNEEIILGEITGTTTFTSTNRALGKHKVVHMDSNGSANTLAESEGWVWYGTKPTATVANKKTILSLVCLGSAVGDVRAVFVEEA